MPTTTSPHALLVDYGGVLTAPTVQATRDWCAGVGITYRQFVGPLIDDADGPSLIHRLETGVLPVEHFERLLGAAISAAAGVEVDTRGFTRDVVGGAPIDDAMLDLLDEVRAAGVPTVLVSNSWGSHYPHDRLDAHLDACVVSGELGVRKPDPAIYLAAAARAGVAAAGCVFVDDLPANVAGAHAVGMTGILHTDAPTTRAAVLQALGPAATTAS